LPLVVLLCSVAVGCSAAFIDLLLESTPLSSSTSFISCTMSRFLADIDSSVKHHHHLQPTTPASAASQFAQHDISKNSSPLHRLVTPAHQSFRFSGTRSHPFQKKQALRNYLTFFGLVGFCTAVYYYTMRAISQDDFSEFEEERRYPNAPPPPPKHSPISKTVSHIIVPKEDHSKK